MLDTRLWWSSTVPAGIEPRPWLHPDVIDYLAAILRPSFTVLEHGSGGSTLWFADRVKSVLAFENKAAWKNKIDQYKKPNVLIILSDDWMNTAAAFGGSFDLFLIDGDPMESRGLACTIAHKLVKPGGWVVLDNANRQHCVEGRKELVKHADLVKAFDRNEGLSKYLVTEFYQMKGQPV